MQLLSKIVLGFSKNMDSVPPDTVSDSIPDELMPTTIDIR